MDNLENAINEAKLEFDKKLEAIYNEYLFGTIFKLKTKEYIDMNMRARTYAILWLNAWQLKIMKCG